MRDVTPDLFFASIAEREVQYNARASVADFDACVRRYAESAARVRAPAGRAEPAVRHGPGRKAGPVPAGRRAGFGAAVRVHPWRLLALAAQGRRARHGRAFNAAGAAVATLEYTLLPEATLPEVVREVRSAVAWLYRNAAAYGVDPARIYVSGSSAGGHLAGMLAAPDWQARYGVPDDVIKGTLALSGLFDLRPLCDISVNDWLRLTPEQARLQSPIFHLPAQAGPMLLAVGGLETQGFKNQTDAYEAAWRAAGLSATRIATPQCNHFDLVNELEDPDSDLTRRPWR